MLSDLPTHFASLRSAYARGRYPVDVIADAFDRLDQIGETIGRPYNLRICGLGYGGYAYSGVENCTQSCSAGERSNRGGGGKTPQAFCRIFHECPH